MFAVCAVALLGLLPVSHSAPLACQDLVRPLDQLDPHHLEGRWALVAGSFSDTIHLEFYKRRHSSSVNFSNVNATSSIVYAISVHVGVQCHHHTYNVSLEGSILTFDAQDQVNLTVPFLQTSCPDCLVMRFDDESQKPLRVYLFSRRRGVDQKETEEFGAQAECLNMTPPVGMDPNNELCPE